MSEVLERLKNDVAAGILPQKYADLIKQFYDSYVQTNERRNKPLDEVIHLFHQFTDLVEEQVATPYQFEPYHQMITEPTDYYTFGVNVISGVVHHEGSHTLGLDHATEIEKQLARGENVVLLSNHQTEADPQAISILMAKTHPHIAKEVICVAGERVLTDPMAAPFSMGRNLLCVYSKKYIDDPPEKREEKQAHNAKTMKVMFKMLEEGGKLIWVAPSGGRDRTNEEGEVVVAPFNPQAVDMFRLIASRVSRPVHFYPMAMSTYHILPPPTYVEGEKWEPRYTKGGPIHLSIGAELDFIGYAADLDKQTRREKLAEYAWDAVNREYQKLPKGNNQ